VKTEGFLIASWTCNLSFGESTHVVIGSENSGHSSPPVQKFLYGILLFIWRRTGRIESPPLSRSMVRSRIGEGV